jgi:hypothetical protein
MIIKLDSFQYITDGIIVGLIKNIFGIFLDLLRLTVSDWSYV